MNKQSLYNMDLIFNESVGQLDIEENPKRAILETALNIQEYRLRTLSPEASIKSVFRKIFLINDLQSDLNQPEEEEPNTKYGSLHEALFFTALRQLNVPIFISNDQEDEKGIDFHICYRPIDVTINPTVPVLQEKIKRNNATVLCLPIYMGQHSVMQFGDEDTVFQNFIDGRLTPNEYLQQIIEVNRDLERILIANMNREKHSLQGYNFDGVTNSQIHNLQHLLGYLSRVLERFQ